MKKTFAILLSLALALLLSACGGSDRPQASQVQGAAPAEGETYTVTIRDQHGNGVSGCVVNFCSDTACSPVTTDEGGVYTFVGEAFAWHVQVVKVPEGYICDTSLEYTMDAGGGNVDVAVTKE